MFNTQISPNRYEAVKNFNWESFEGSAIELNEQLQGSLRMLDDTVREAKWNPIVGCSASAIMFSLFVALPLILTATGPNGLNSHNFPTACVLLGDIFMLPGIITAFSALKKLGKLQKELTREEITECKNAWLRQIREEQMDALQRMNETQANAALRRQEYDNLTAILSQYRDPASIAYERKTYVSANQILN